MTHTPDTIEGKHGKVRKNDWGDVRVCYRCGVLFLPMAKTDWDGSHERDTACPRCDEPVTVDLARLDRVRL